MPYQDEVSFTLPGAETPESMVGQCTDRIKAVEFTRGGLTVQAGYVHNFRIERDATNATVLAATIWTDAEIDFDNGPALHVSGFAAGNLTIVGRSSTTMVPLFF